MAWQWPVLVWGPCIKQNPKRWCLVSTSFVNPLVHPSTSSQHLVLSSLCVPCKTQFGFWRMAIQWPSKKCKSWNCPLPQCAERVECSSADLSSNWCIPSHYRNELWPHVYHRSEPCREHQALVVSKQKKISPKSAPNSQKQKQLPNTQWVKYVYCPALLTLEVGRTRRNHSTNTLWKPVFPKVFAILWPKFPKLVRRLFPKELLSASLFTSST